MTTATAPLPAPGYCFDRYEWRPAERALLADGAPVGLGGRAFDLLVALLERRDRVVGKNELMDIVWPNLVVEENNLQAQIVALRKLMGPDAIGRCRAAVTGSRSPCTPWGRRRLIGAIRRAAWNR